ncbi:MAG: heme ABC exporter ATP-binding protein CcmA [Bacteroidota bacterium]
MNIKVEHVSVNRSGHQVLNDLSFELQDGHILSVMGKSGCGKTTLLRVIAGLGSADTGTIIIGGRDVTGIPPQERRAVYLYQEALLFPHLNVLENLAFGLKIRGENKKSAENKARDMLEQLDLTSHAHKKSEQLSGGQRQRVAFGRALLVSPSVLLLDEPFSNLDSETRMAMQQLYRKMAQDRGITTIFVTHDLKEAVIMGSRLSYMEEGKLRIYDDLQTFAADPRTGMQREIGFWQSFDKR